MLGVALSCLYYCAIGGGMIYIYLTSDERFMVFFATFLVVTIFIRIILNSG